jgi:putative DNA primase/helicase
MSIQSLTTDKFRTASLVGKLVNISNEEESKFIKADVLKALITGDTMTAERKFGDPFSFTPNTKFAFCTNEMPSFDTLNYGLKRRIKFIPFYRRFKDNEQDKELQEKLSQEIPGIIGWAIKGARRFVANDSVFKQSQSAIDKLQSFSEELSSALTFFNEFYIIDVALTTANSQVYYEYSKWCEDNGRKPLNSNNFWKDLNKEFGDQFEERTCSVFDVAKNCNIRAHAKNVGLKADINVEKQAEIVIEDIEF